MSASIPQIVYGKFLIFIDAAASSDGIKVTLSQDGVPPDNFAIEFQHTPDRIVLHHGSVTNWGSLEWSTAHPYFVWFVYNQGAGTASMWLAASDVKPADPDVTVTGGNGANTSDVISLQTKANDKFFFDDLKLSTSTFE